MLPRSERNTNHPPCNSAHAPFIEQIDKHAYQNQSFDDERGGDGVGQGGLEGIRVEQYAVDKGPVDADGGEKA